MGFDAEAPFRKGPTTGAGLGSKRMYSAFKKWAQRHHTFADVELLSTELEILSSGTQLLLENRKVSGGNRKFTVIPVLQWNFPPETSQNDLKIKTLTADQKIANTIFLRLLRDVWNDAHDNVLQKLMESLVKSEVLYQKEKSITKQQKNNPRSAISVREEKHGEKYIDIDIMRVGEGEEEKKGREESKWDEQEGKEKFRFTTKHDECKSMEEESTFEVYKKYKKDAGFQVREKHNTKSAIHLLGIDKLNTILNEDNDRRTQRKHEEEVDRIEEAR